MLLSSSRTGFFSHELVLNKDVYLVACSLCTRTYIVYTHSILVTHNISQISRIAQFAMQSHNPGPLTILYEIYNSSSSSSSDSGGGAGKLKSNRLSGSSSPPRHHTLFCDEGTISYCVCVSISASVSFPDLHDLGSTGDEVSGHGGRGSGDEETMTF